MNFYLSLVSVASIAIAVILSRLVTRRIIDVASKAVDRKTHLLIAPVGSAILFVPDDQRQTDYGGQCLTA